MKRSLLFSMHALLLTVFLPASDMAAAVFSRDWKAPGDGLLTYDDVNQREWLDLTETLLFQFPNGLDGVLAELEPGGQFDGFVWATYEDIAALGESAGIDTTTTDFAINEAPAKALIQLLGVTAFSGTSTGTWGLADNTAALGNPDPIVTITQAESTARAGVRTFSSFGGLDRPGRIAGVWIHRPIPEPSASVLVLLGTLCLLASSSPWPRRISQSVH